jgi:uncharacterized protein YlaN (UPF0358 family)
MNIRELINKPIIRNDHNEEWLNKLTNEEIAAWDKEMIEECAKEGTPYKFPDMNAAFLSKHIDTTIIYNLIKIEMDNLDKPQPPSPPKDKIHRESSWLETITFGLYKTKKYHRKL